MGECQAEIAVKTRLPPCCLRIIDNQFVLVGTYRLDAESGYRTGSLELYDENLVLLKSYETYGAILDVKLSPFDSKLAATAHSTGNVTLWRILAAESGDIPTLQEIANLQLFDTDTLITSLHFSSLDPVLLLVTGTSGEAATVDIVKKQPISKFSRLEDAYTSVEESVVAVQGCSQRVVNKEPQLLTEQHSLECWTGEFGSLQPLQDVVFTGGDDATIMAHDMRSRGLIWSNSRIHDAGVVAIKCSTANFRQARPTSIVTGSYDDCIRLLELRMLGGQSIYPGQNTPVAKFWSENLNGGVWRFCERPEAIGGAPGVDELLVCCMYNGAKLIGLDDRKMQQDFSFTELSYLKQGHDSMCYGGDWCENFVVTCSFYDNSLQKWHPDRSDLIL
ncbi:hypothetical protein HG536_0D01900 [Torulaspora globosa]|uniref:methylated diphthine methylhydrolase n=1 Tax=Torulaspora globosa TaxID=48254 RepID=A0A7G3ZGN2_9SACH|nr:uncharacterized protein HG536_0D01900 [Torulaspora globosa]QLL32668.1 hypothetical protein HG536_0D01900 [Torulaspora globosa]